MSRVSSIVGQMSCAALLSMAAGRATAQIDTSGQWRYVVTPYLWTLSLHGRVGVGPVATDADISFDDILKALKFAAMVNGEVRHGQWMGTIDVIYSSLAKTAVIPFRGDTGSLEAHAEAGDPPTARRLHDRRSEVGGRLPRRIPPVVSEDDDRRRRHPAPEQPTLNLARMAGRDGGLPISVATI